MHPFYSKGRTTWLLMTLMFVPTCINLYHTTRIFSPIQLECLNSPSVVELQGNDSASTLYGRTSKIINEGGLTRISNSSSSSPLPSSKEPYPSLLPKHLISVFGLESSGTTFVASTLVQATAPGSEVSGYFSKFTSTEINDEGYQIQHISLPHGYISSHHAEFHQQFLTLPVVEVQLPEYCIKSRIHQLRQDDGIPSKAPQPCQKAYGFDYLPLYPRRYFVNITSHVQFYQERGVDVSVVIVVRDKSLHFRGIYDAHCLNRTAAEEQFQLGRTLILEALNNPKIRPYIKLVSYETLMMLQRTYLLQLYQELGINSTYVPKFKDGNAKYIQTKISKNNETAPLKQSSHPNVKTALSWRKASKPRRIPTKK